MANLKFQNFGKNIFAFFGSETPMGSEGHCLYWAT